MPIGRKLALASTLAALIAIGIAALSRSSGQSAATQPVVTVSPQARDLLDQIRQAYASLKTISISGKLEGHFDVDGVRQDKTGQFTGLYSSSGLFRSEMKDSSTGDPAATQPTRDAVVGNTGEKVFLFLPDRNRYLMMDAPKDKISLDSLGDDVADILRNQDLSLALAISGDAADELLQEATSVGRVDDVQIDGHAFPAIIIVHPQYDETLAIDPHTHLLRRATADLSKKARMQGAGTVKTAVLTMDYAYAPSAPADAAQFAWSPPPGAQELSPVLAASDLDGKPAPPFSLTDVDGKPVTSQGLKGSVYVLDFWATWCGPCVASLPQLDGIYKDVKDKGVKFFAVNEQEDIPTIRKFVSDTKLAIPVLTDSDGKVGEIYDSDGAIPFTVVVGRDGKIVKAAHMGGVEDQLRPIIADALKQ
jgi:thiol-disulfide isomerase/thioredoxin